MKKKTFRHECSISAEKIREKNRGNKSGKSKNGSVEKSTVTEIYNKYYKNQVAALYNAVRGY